MVTNHLQIWVDSCWGTEVIVECLGEICIGRERKGCGLHTFFVDFSVASWLEGKEQKESQENYIHLEWQKQDHKESQESLKSQFPYDWMIRFDLMIISTIKVKTILTNWLWLLFTTGSKGGMAVSDIVSWIAIDS